MHEVIISLHLYVILICNRSVITSYKYTRINKPQHGQSTLQTWSHYFITFEFEYLHIIFLIYNTQGKAHNIKVQVWRGFAAAEAKLKELSKIWVKLLVLKCLVHSVILFKSIENNPIYPKHDIYCKVLF